MKRPKSAIIMSIPYNFQSKEDAIAVKRKALDLFNQSTQDYITTKRSHTNQTFRSHPSYCDKGPSLFYSVRSKYSQAKRKLKRDNRLKPCKQINARSIQIIKKYLNETRTESQLINMVLNNSNKNNLNTNLLKTFQSNASKLKKSTLKNKENNHQNFSILGDKKKL